MTQEAKAKAKPVHEVRIGTLKAAVWAKTNEQGRTRYDVSFCRIFKRKNGTGWEYSEYFNRDELPLLAKVIDQAHDWVVSQKQSAPATEQPVQA